MSGMSDSATEQSPQTPNATRGHLRSFAADVLRMPRWQKSLLTLAVLLLGVGSTGQVAGYFSGGSGASATKSDSGAEVSLVTSEKHETVAPKPTLTERISPWMTKVGLSFIVGFVVGWLLRTFLKTVALIGGGIIALLMLLSYLGYDLSGAQKEYTSFMSWLTDQGQRLAKALLDHLPGSTSSAAGMFVGFRRR